MNEIKRIFMWQQGMKWFFMCLFLILLTISASRAFGCSIVMAARNGLVLVGNNEDRNHPETQVNFMPATDKYFGRIVFGYDDSPFQGGMNDQGLFIDGNSLAPTGWQPLPGKPTFRGVVILVVLGTCATCDDVKDFFEEYNVPGLERARFPVADQTGASMVVEYGQGAVQFVETDTWYQIATNFVMSNISSGNYPCQRYRDADAILSGAKELSFGLIREALNKTHQDGGSLTVYSNIYDLKNRTIHTYLLGNFEEAIIMNFDEELEKGQRRNTLASLFDARPEPLLFTVEDMQQDFRQLRSILENEHCCMYEYTGKEEFDSIFDEHFKLIDRPMRANQFFKLTASIVAKVGCMHTALWMPGAFFDTGSDNLFPLQVKFIEEKLVVSGCYEGTPEIPVGSIILEINNRKAADIFDELRTITSADALNPYFIDSQIEKRFAMFYASLFGFPDKYEISYILPGKKTRMTTDLIPTDIGSVRNVVFANFNHPPLGLEFLEDISTAILTVKTFSYYDRVDYFRDFMDETFLKIKDKGIQNLILDLRGNDGGDPFCSVILYSYLEKQAAPYFSEPYGKYAKLADPIPVAPNHFSGRLFTLLDGRCGSTNGHFSALLKYHRIGEFVGTPSGSTYKCNAGSNTEARLDKTKLILTFGRSTFAAAVKGMDKASPIMPDHPVQVKYQDFLDSRDVFMETTLDLIKN